MTPELLFRPVVDTRRFFDWASTSPVSAACAAAMEDHTRAALAHPSPPDFLTEHTRGVDSLRDEIRAVFAAPPAVDVALVRSVAEASSAMARTMAVPRGANIVVTAADHPALVAPWCWLTGTRPDVELRTIRSDVSGCLDLEHAERLVDAATAVVTCTHLTHLDGVLQPVSALAELVRRHSGALLIVDGAQSAGRIPVRFDRLGADVYTASGRKALLGPLGAGFLIAGPGVLDSFGPLVFSARNCSVHARADGRWRPGARHAGGSAVLEGNLPDLRLLSGLAASLAAYRQAGPARLARRCCAAAEQVARLLPAVGLRAVGPSGSGRHGIGRWRSPSVRDHRELKAQLGRVGFSLAATREWIRISVHAFTAADDIARLCDHLRPNAATHLDGRQR
ncbi:aminotransferase class V-fold PLP-dependent enzyme [Streptomyces sp. NPDC001492]